MLTPSELSSLPGILRVEGVRIRSREGDAFRALVLWVSRGRAVALGKSVFLPADRADDLALIAHELMHCRQHEEWGPARYYLRGMIEQSRYLLSRLGLARNPYDWRSAPLRALGEYGMEQQGQIVEDAVRGDPVARGILES